MPFLNIKYKRELNIFSDSRKIIDAIEKELVRLKVDKIEIADLEIDFRNSFLNRQSRIHLMAPVDKGNFKINEDLQMLEYSFSIDRMLYIALAMSVVFGLITQSYLAGIMSFIVLFGMNLIITLIRQNFFLNKLKRRLSENNTTHNNISYEKQ